MALLLKDEVYAIMGAAMEVHDVPGPGFLEAVYQEALEIELETGGIPFRPRVSLPLTYKGVPMKKHYEADLVCFDQIIIEIKAASALAGEHAAQLLNYLKATGFRVGLLINFGSSGSLEWKRMVL